MTAPTDEQSESSAGSPRRRPRRRRYVVAGVVLVMLAGAWLGIAASNGPETATLSDWIVELVGDQSAVGPEHFDIDQHGAIYTGLLDGRIVRIDPDHTVHTIADADGRPLGVALHATEHLVVADREHGLIAVSAEGDVRVLVADKGGDACCYFNGVAVGPDGVIYFTQPTTRYAPKDIAESAITADSTGRLYSHDPATGETRTVAEGLRFANGVGVIDGGDTALVCETFARRIVRVTLRGDDAGRTDVWADDLPGYPDNIAIDDDGNVWVAIHTDRNGALDIISSIPILPHLIAPFLGDVGDDDKHQRAAGRILVFDADGNIVRHMRDTSISYGPISTARPHNGYVYLGSSSDTGIGRMAMPAFDD